MAATITYKGNTIATVTNQTKTLTTSGKYMEADVVVTDVQKYIGTILSTGSQYNGYVRLVNDANETRYYTSGDIFLFSPGDELYMYAKGARSSGTITIDGEEVAIDGIDAAYEALCPECFIKKVLNITKKADINKVLGKRK